MPAPRLTSSTQATASLSDAVVVRSSRTIDLSAQRGAVDHHVLEQLRNALHLNDFFVRLSLANNPLRDNCVAAVCAILKDQNYLSSLSLENCDLLDKDVTYYFVPALLSRGQLRYLDLSKNTQLTDAVAEALARLIREGELLELRLIGVPLTRKSGKIITDALALNGSLTVCELPYTIGFEALNDAAHFIQRNLRHRQMVKDQESNRAAMEKMVSLQREAQTTTRVALAMELHANASQAPADTASERVASAISSSDAESGSPIALLGGQAADERHQLARYYTEHGRKNALIVPPPSRGAPGTGRLPKAPFSSSSRGRPGMTSRAGSRGKSPGQTRTSSRRGVTSSSSQRHARLGPNPPLTLPPVRTTGHPGGAAAAAQSTNALVLPEAEWQNRVDPVTSRAMLCLDLLRQPKYQ